MTFSCVGRQPYARGRVVLIGVAAWALSYVVCSEALAQPVDKATCSAAFEDAQRLRKARRLVDARKALVTCAQEACPKLARGPCSEWLAEVEKSLPSIVVTARTSSGTDTADARLLVDGAAVRDKLDGTALFLDPGEHVVRIEPAGREPREVTILLAEGEKGRAIRFEIAEGRDNDKAPGTSGYVLSAIGWSGFITSGIALSVGTALGAASIAMGPDCEVSVCSNAELDVGIGVSHAATAHFTLAGVAAVVGVLGAVLWSTDANTPGPKTSFRLGGTTCELQIAF